MKTSEKKIEQMKEYPQAAQATPIKSVQIIATHHHQFFGMLESTFKTPTYQLSLRNDDVIISRGELNHYYAVPRSLCIIEFSNE